MSNFIERINLATVTSKTFSPLPEQKALVETRENYSINCDDLRSYCADKDIDIKDVAEHELIAACDLIDKYAKSSANEYEFIAFWID